MKGVFGIGTFVVVLVVGLVVATYVLTRPPHRDLDAGQRAWVTSFVTWRDRQASLVDRAYVRMGYSTESRNARLMAPLRHCSASFARLGDVPKLFEFLPKDVASACREAEYAVSVNARFGTSSLATTKQHLQRSAGWFQEARRDIRDGLGQGAGEAIGGSL